MSKTATVTARIQPEVKQAAESVFSHLGLTASQAITLFYRQVELHGGLPFDVRLPGLITREAIRQAVSGEGLETLDSVDDLFADLDA